MIIMEKIYDISQLDLSRYIQPGDHVIWGQAQSEPTPLTQNLMQHRNKIGKFSVFLGISQYPTCQTEYSDYIKFSSYCGTGYNRPLAKQHLLDILPVHYSQFPTLIEQRLLPVDVVLIQVSEPNIQGQYSYSLGQDYLKSAIQHARIVIAEVNKQAPWTHSDHYLTEDNFDVLVYTDRKIESPTESPLSEISLSIARHAASIIKNGSTLQLGIGSIPEAILTVLGQHQDLGIHSGIISDGVMQLMKQGVINNQKKSIDSGLTVAGLISGSAELHQYVHKNLAIQLRPTEYTHHAKILCQLDNFIAINSAIEVDLTGQINTEIANHTYVGAVGGALDFIRAANHSNGGLSIIALPSSGTNFSRIVSHLQGTVATPRSDAAVIITEYGIADLRGLTTSQRTQKMISIAAPDYRHLLEKQAQELKLI